MMFKKPSPASVIYLILHVLLVLIGVIAFTALKEPFSSAIGGSLVAAGVTGWVIFVYLLLTEQTRRRLETVTRFGIISGYTGRGAAIKSSYDGKLDSAKSVIDIMEFGLRALREDYLDEFSNWKGRAKVRILLLDPYFPEKTSSYAQQRDEEERNAENTIVRDVEKFIDETMQLMDERFQVRLYRCLPSINVFRVDDELFWGPYLMNEQSRNAPTFVVGRSGLLFGPLIEHFDNVWSQRSITAREWRGN